MAILNDERPTHAISLAGKWERRTSPFIGHPLAILGLTVMTLSAVLLCLLGLQTRVLAQEPNGEYALKAAFLYNFAKFTEWPPASFADNRAPFVICVVGQDSFGANLDNLTGKVVRDRQLVTKRIRTEAHLNDCHILYVSPSALKQTSDILRTLQKASVLTVCDAEGCAEAGFMLNMRLADNRITLELNLEVVQQTQLKLSSQLIKLTHIVKGHS